MRGWVELAVQLSHSDSLGVDDPIVHLKLTHLGLFIAIYFYQRFSQTLKCIEICKF